MTDAELNILYDFKSPNSLATVYTDQLQIIHDFHGCKVLNNSCTPDEIAAQQWGSSNITMNFYSPYKATSYLSSTGLSVTDVWGLFTREPEYFFYANQYLKGDDLFHIPPSSVGRIMNNVTGLTDITKTAIFIINVTQGVNVEVYNRQLDIPSATAFLKGLRFMVQDYIMGGLITQRTAKEWVNGWQSSIFDLVQQGDFFLGTDKDLD